MALAEYVEPAKEGRCVICRRRLPKRRIALYTARVNSWDRMSGEDIRDIEIAVCGEKCLERYEQGEVPA